MKKNNLKKKDIAKKMQPATSNIPMEGIFKDISDIKKAQNTPKRLADRKWLEEKVNEYKDK